MDFEAFWVSEELSANEAEINRSILTIYPNLKRIGAEGGDKTLHIGPKSQVSSKIGTKLTFITPNILAEAAKSVALPKDLIVLGTQLVSTCLKSHTITVSGFDALKKRKLAAKVRLLGGSFVHDLSTEVTVVIGDSMSTKLSFMAYTRGIPVVSTSWIDDCWKSELLKPPLAYRIRPFLGLSFTSTELTSTQRSTLSSVVSRFGGSWSDKFTEETSILVTPMLELTKKTVLALKKQIPIVSPEWILRLHELNVSKAQFLHNLWHFGLETQVFSGFSFGLEVTLENKELIVDAIIGNGGTSSKEPSYWIVSERRRPEGHSTFVSLRWLWHSIHAKRPISLEELPLLRPIPIQKPVPGLESQTVAVIGEEDSVRILLGSILRELGATVYYSITKGCSLIVSLEYKQDLSRKAAKKGLKVVGIPWVVNLAETGVFSTDDDSNKENVDSNKLMKAICDKIIKAAPPKPAIRAENLKEIKDITEFTQQINSMSAQTSPVRILTQKYSSGEEIAGKDPLLLLLE